MKEYTFNYEIYTKNPTTNECGWDIKMVDIEADNKKEADVLVKEYPNYDCTILFNYQIKNK